MCNVLCNCEDAQQFRYITCPAAKAYLCTKFAMCAHDCIYNIARLGAGRGMEPTAWDVAVRTWGVRIVAKNGQLLRNTWTVR